MLGLGKPKRQRGGDVGQSMARRLVVRGAQGQWLDRLKKAKNGKDGVSGPIPASLEKFFKPLGGN